MSKSISLLSLPRWSDIGTSPLRHPLSTHLRHNGEEKVRYDGCDKASEFLRTSYPFGVLPSGRVLSETRGDHMPQQQKLGILGLHHIAIVLPNVEEAAARYWEALGIGPWAFLQFDGNLFHEVILRGKPAPDLVVQGAMAMIGPTALAFDWALTEPNMYQDFYESHGPGVHHLAFAVEDFDAADAQMRAMGYEHIVTTRGMGPDPNVANAYYDSAARLGVAIELAQMPASFPPPPKTYPADPTQAPPSSLGSRFVHVALAVKDAEGLAHRYWDDLGIGPWAIMDFGEGVEDTRYLGEKTEAVLRVAATQVGPVQIAFEQAKNRPNPLGDYVDAKGEGVHHLCFGVPDLDVAIAEMKEHGYEAVMVSRGFGSNKDGQAAYFDTASTLGVTIECAVPPSAMDPPEKFYPEMPM